MALAYFCLLLPRDQRVDFLRHQCAIVECETGKLRRQKLVDGMIRVAAQPNTFRAAELILVMQVWLAVLSELQVWVASGRLVTAASSGKTSCPKRLHSYPSPVHRIHCLKHRCRATTANCRD
jgi:type IV secretory pathway TrbD component